MRNADKGFSVIEMLVVIAAIALISTIGLFSFSKHQADTRDAERMSKANVLVEALEKYYENNGEYPTCDAMTQSTDIITTELLPGVDPNAFITPRAEEGITNAIICAAVSPTNPDDVFSYINEQLESCQIYRTCLLYEIQYRQESDGSIKSIKSRRGGVLGEPAA